MNKARGFSLLELLIVVAIILIIATIAIPSLLRSRQAANETSAVATLKVLNTAEVTYSSTGGAYGTMADLVNAGLVDSSLYAVKAGYNYGIDLSADHLNYTATAFAAAVNTGRYDYYTAPDYVIRYTSDTTRSPAGLSGEPVR